MYYFYAFRQNDKTFRFVVIYYRLRDVVLKTNKQKKIWLTSMLLYYMYGPAWRAANKQQINPKQ